MTFIHPQKKRFSEAELAVKLVLQKLVTSANKQAFTRTRVYVYACLFINIHTRRSMYVIEFV